MVLLNLLEREQISRLVRRFLMEKRTLWRNTQTGRTIMGT